MKKNIFHLLPVFCIVLLIASCTKKDKTGLLVPKDAAFVMHINSSSFSSKLSWEDIKATNWFKKIYAGQHDSLAEKLINDPSSSGVDAKSDFVYFVQIQNNGAHLVIDGKLKDAAVFENHCKKLMPETTITKDGNFSSLALKDKMAIVWNKDWFAYVVALPDMNRGRFRNRDDMGSMPDSASKDFLPSIPGMNADSLKKIGKEILSLSDTKTLGTDERFAKLVKEQGDIHVWVNVEKFYSGGGANPYMSMMKLNSLLEGNIYATSISFDNGKITATGKHYYGKEMDRLARKYAAKPVDASLINRLPSENVLAVMAWNYSPEGLKEILKTIGMDGLLNLFLTKQNLSIDDLIKANKGEMLFALTDIEPKTTADTFLTGKGKKPVIFNHEKPGIKLLFANAINNKESFDKLMGILKGEKGEFPPVPMENFTYQVKDNWFAAGDPDNVSAFLSGKSNTISFANRVSGHPLCVYINIQRIFNTVLKSKTDSTNAALLGTSMNMWQDAVFTSGDYKDGAINFSAEINLVNKNTNSLKQINQYIDQLAGIFSDRFAFEKNNMDRIILDTLQTEPKTKTQ